MKKNRTKFVTLFVALVMLLSFAFTACDAQKSDGLGELRDIYIVTNGLQTVYTVGDEFDYGKVKFRAVYENGDETLKATDSDKGVTHSELDMSTAGTKTLTVTYKEKSAEVNITVNEKKTYLQGLQFAGGKTAYTVGETVDFAQFTFKAQFSTGNDVDLNGESDGVTHDPATVSTDTEKSVSVKFTYEKDGESASAVVPVTVTAAPAPKTLISIEVQSSSADRTVEYGSTLGDSFYEKFTLVLHYSDGTTDDTAINGSSKGVTHDTINTNQAGEHELTFTYNDVKSAPVYITVLPEKETLNLNRFALPAFYSNVMGVKSDAEGTASTDRDTFMKGMKSETDEQISYYKVGDDNAFEFQPQATVLVDLTHQSTITVKTEFTLQMKQDDGSFDDVPAETYVTTNENLPNFYWFKEVAIGRVFKFTIKPDHNAYTGDAANSAIEAYFEIVDGYNVYDQTGLSVFDNLNVKHWKDIKEEAGVLRWDSKPLTYYNVVSGDNKSPVANIVLHSDITINPDYLPDSYFWKNTDTEYSSIETQLKGNTKIPTEVSGHLDGSLKDGIGVGSWYKFDDTTSGELKEDVATSVNMQKGIYNSTGTGIEGNFHLLTYMTDGLKHHLYTVYDGKDHKTDFGSAFPLSHFSLFKYGQAQKAESGKLEVVNGGNPVISDLRIVGKSPRTPSTNGEPSHLMALNTCTNSVTLSNCVISQLFCAGLGDTSSSGINVADCKIFDIYSNMFYLWRSKIEVTNSIMEDAGGPVFILCDGNRAKNVNDEGPQLVVDSKSRLKSDASGQESWYVLNNAGAIFTNLKTQVLDLIHKGTKRQPMHKGTGDVELYNVIAIVVPEPANLQGNSELTIFPKGTIKRGEEGIYTDDYAVDWKFNTGGLLSMVQKSPDDIYNSNAPIFISGTEKAAYIKHNTFPYLGATVYNEQNDTPGSIVNTNFAPAPEGRGTDWLFVTLKVTESDPRFGILFGDVTKYSA